MLKKRLIFTLLYSDGNFMLSRNFKLQKVGNLNWLNENYNFSKISFFIDELIILDVSRNNRDLDIFCFHIKTLTKNCFVPISAGGGINNLIKAKTLLKSGADKIVINSLLDSDIDMVFELAKTFGNQCIVASVDVKKEDNVFKVVTQNGSKVQKENAKEWIRKIQNYPVGEIYLNSIDKDGTGQGLSMEILDLIPDSFSLPIILSGGVGFEDHIFEGLSDERINAVSTAHLLNFIGDGLKTARNALIDKDFNLAEWDNID